MLLIWSAQVPSFARRSSVLADLREVSLDEGRCQAAKPMETLRPQNQQYQLNGKKHHQYPSPCRERDADRRGDGKKLYYQLSSKKHHRYQPELKVPGSLCAEGPDTEAPRGKAYNLPPGLQQKWVRDEDSGCLTKVKDITLELQKLPADLSGPTEAQKVGCAEGGAPQAEGARSRKLKIVKNKNKNGRIVIVMSKYLENGIHSARAKAGQTAELASDGGAENHAEKMRLVRELGLMSGLAKGPSDTPTGPGSGPDKDAKVKAQAHPDRAGSAHTDTGGGQAGPQALKRPLPEPAGQERRAVKRFVASASSAHTQETEQEEPMDLRVVKPTATEAPAGRREAELQTAAGEKPPKEAFPSFQPSLGNVVITDITANCLTVTFKEYVAAARRPLDAHL